MRKVGSKIRDSRVDSGSMDLEMPSMEISPKSPLEALDDALNAVMPNNPGTLATPTPPPRNKLNVRDSRNSLSSKMEKHKPLVSEQNDWAEVDLSLWQNFAKSLHCLTFSTLQSKDVSFKASIVNVWDVFLIYLSSRLDKLMIRNATWYYLMVLR